MDIAGRVERITARRALAALMVLALGGVLVGYGVARRARPEPVRVAAQAQGGRGVAAATPRAKLLVVHVAGAVARPGVYRLLDGSRVHDAVEAAGGVAGDADLESLNLAGRVRDGDKVLVPARSAAAPGGAAAGGAASGRINLNKATVAELDTLPGIGPALAQRIIDFREQKGGFRAVSDLGKVPGIGPKKLAELEDLVTV